MPLTKLGKKMFVSFNRQYGLKGKDYFYAYMKKYPKRTKSWHKFNF